MDLIPFEEGDALLICRSIRPLFSSGHFARTAEWTVEKLRY